MGSDNERSGCGPFPVVQLTAKLQLSAGQFIDLSGSELGDDSPPLGDRAWCETECASSDAGLTVLGIEEMKNVFLEHAIDYSILKTDSNHALEQGDYPTQMQTMGDRIRLLRQARGFSQTDLAERVGVTGGAISQWELGGTKNIKLETFLKLCSELGTEPHYLIFGPDRQGAHKSRTRQA